MADPTRTVKLSQLVDVCVQKSYDDLNRLIELWVVIIGRAGAPAARCSPALPAFRSLPRHVNADDRFVARFGAARTLTGTPPGATP